MQNKILSLDIITFPEWKEVVDKAVVRDDIIGIKIGASLALRYGLNEISSHINLKAEKDIKIIYDHQKAGTDVPHTSENFAKVMRTSGIEYSILFPRIHHGRTQREWTKQLLDKDVTPIVGGYMTTSAPMDFRKSIHIYEIALCQGVENFVIPANDFNFIKQLFLEIPEIKENTFYVPGFGKQGGDLDKFDAFMKNIKWYPIIGRSLMEELI